MNVSDFLNKAIRMEGFITASLTDEFIVDTWPMANYSLDDKEEKILEIRIFNVQKEEKLYRTDISKDFIYREICDDGRDYFDEFQFFDIDTKRSSQMHGNMVTTTGGGVFYLPLPEKENAGLKVRYYLDRYEKTGHVKIADWRLVDFISGKGGK